MLRKNIQRRKKRKQFAKNTIVKQNPKIDKNLIKNAECFEKKISKFGETIKPKYTLTQPFDAPISRLDGKENAEYFQKLWGDPLEQERQDQLDYHKQISRKYKHD